jgi:4'-phosphopantetheinyl transferase
MSNTRWITPAGQSILEANQVHVWRTSLDVPGTRLIGLAKLLSSDEEARSSGYRFLEDRRRFVVARGLLRIILARYLRTNPKDLDFIFSETGKPEIHPDVNAGIQFSVSHSHDRALFALARDRDVGVDVEHIRTDCAIDSIAQLFFSPEEQASIKSLPDPLKHRAFFSCWCRKEAIVKALGRGLPFGLHRFEVSVLPGDAAKLRSTSDDAIEIKSWSLVDLAVCDGYEGALAIKSPTLILKCWDATGI